MNDERKIEHIAKALYEDYREFCGRQEGDLPWAFAHDKQRRLARQQARTALKAAKEYDNGKR